MHLSNLLRMLRVRSKLKIAAVIFPIAVIIMMLVHASSVGIEYRKNKRKMELVDDYVKFVEWGEKSLITGEISRTPWTLHEEARDVKTPELEKGKEDLQAKILKQEDKREEKVPERKLKSHLSRKRKSAKNSTELKMSSTRLKQGLNSHIWNELCGFQVESLRYFILYPISPSKRRCIRDFKSRTKGRDIGQRIFGFLRPDMTGEYKFAISSKGNSELWLSSDDDSTNLHRIAFIGDENERKTTNQGVYGELETQMSKAVNLTKGDKYFVEVLYKHVKGKSRVEVAWMKPDTKTFEIIPKQFLSPAVDDGLVKDGTIVVSDYREQDFKLRMGAKDLDFMEFIDFGNTLPSCDYKPSYYVQGKLVRYQGARDPRNTHFPAVYPPDGTNVTLPLVKNNDVWWTENGIGNDVIDNQTAMDVGQKFKRELESQYEGTFKAIRMISLERVQDRSRGDRFLIEVEVEDVYSGRHYRINEYIYKPRDSAAPLCFPKGFRWDKQAIVNIIVPLKDSGRWALYLIRNVAEIIQRTRDRKIRLVIIDYESQDIDLKAVLRQTSLLPYMYTVVTLPRDTPFRRAQALQRGADAVKEPNSILFFCDLHLQIPANLIEIIRKHCVEGKMAFNPVVMRLRCGNYPKLPFGYWENLGFGLFALFKSDFTRVGGMNEKEFTGWGGEDWELLDRILESRMEVERLKVPDFYHFYHPAYQGHNQRANA